MDDVKISSNRSFGIVFFIFFLLVSVYFYLKYGEILFWTIAFSLVFLILGILNSKLLTPLNKLWFKFGILLGNIISPIIMGIIFFLVVTPTALLLKLFNKDVLNLKKNNNKSYWINRSKVVNSMKKQFIIVERH